MLSLRYMRSFSSGMGRAGLSRRLLSTAAAGPRVLVLGAQGALGSAVLSKFETKGWEAISADVGVVTESFGKRVRFAPSAAWSEQIAVLKDHLEGSAPLDAVVCTAGGWAGGGAGATPGELVASTENMLSVCLRTAITAAHVACKHLSASGVFVVVGSEAALQPTPGMLGYGMAKAATHHLLLSVAPPAELADGKKDVNRLPAGSRAYAVLPRVLDTPSNRKWMSEGADTSTWTPLTDVADKIFEWAAPGRGSAASEPSGSFLIPETKGGKTSWTVRRALYAE